ncbi:MAG: TrkH family potassium uptake protein [Candidatus Methanosuratincola sp.]|jgi:trk system potassium uptake protein TrkH|nr:TrkH family potassium uptake protein [Candidatus Methanosuratincola sp.]
MIEEVKEEILSGLLGLLVIYGVILLLPVIPALVYAEFESAVPFLATGILVATLSFLVRRKIRARESYSRVSSIVIASAGWMLVSAIGAIPFVAVMGFNPLDALFESMSGFTTTGMTLITDFEATPHSILFWRSLTQWIGGVGIILLFTLILVGGGIGSWRLYHLEGREEKFTMSTIATIKRIWLIYTVFTAICAIVLLLLGMPPFDAVNTSMAALSTGGFLTKGSILQFGRAEIQVVLCVFMTIGAISFSLFYNILRFDYKHILRDVETKFLIGILLICGVLVAAFLLIAGFDPGYALLEGFFNTIAIMTTTGFSSVDLNTWPLAAKSILLLLMMIGGCSGSTAGGMKVWRFIVMYRAAKMEISKISLPPIAVKPIKIGGKALEEGYAVRVGAFVFLYVFAILVQFVVMSAMVPDALGAISLVASAQGNVGPAFYPVTKVPLAGKALLIASMWFGRLELFPVLALFSKELVDALRAKKEKAYV